MNTYDAIRAYMFNEPCEYAEEVERGRRLLDEKLGSAFWRNPLMSNDIKFYSSTKDVLGLIFQQYHIGIRLLGLDRFADDPEWGTRPDGLVWDRGIRQKAIEYGFCPNTSEQDSAEQVAAEEKKLADAWKLMLMKEMEAMLEAFPPLTGFSGD